MSKFDEILNSSNPSDALLGEQIDALQTNWSISNISTTVSSNMYFENTDNLKQYYDKAHGRVVIILIGTTNKVIPAKTVFTVGNVTSMNTMPKGNVTMHYKYTDSSKEYRLTKNGGSNLGVVFSNIGAELPIGTEISMQIEYSVLP